MCNLPIGMFDSGIGGLTLFSRVEQLYPLETIYYLADTAHFPYGEKTPEQIIQYSLENAKQLMEQGVKLIVIACFTASALAYRSVLSISNVPVVSVMDCLIEELLKVGGRRVAILGTRATIGSSVIQDRLPDDWDLFPIIASELINLIERGGDCRNELSRYREYFAGQNIDTVALACTHFAHVLPLMREYFGEGITIVEITQAAAEKIGLLIEPATVKGLNQYIVTGPEAITTFG